LKRLHLRVCLTLTDSYLILNIFFMKFFVVLAVGVSSLSAQTQIVIETSLGQIPITLFDDEAPLTVANFLGYVERGDYDDTIFHRSIPGFILQTGGFAVTDSPETNLVEALPTQAPVVNEFSRSNLVGTIAMAKLGGDPDSATSQWFVNLDDNSSNLDVQNGGFTVFGEVTDLTVVNEIVSRPVVNVGGAFTDLPLLELGDAGAPIEREDLIVITGVTTVPEPSTAVLWVFGLLGLLQRRR